MTAPHPFRKHDYKCSKCGNPKDKDELFARRVQFVQLGFKGKLIKSRTTDWLCVVCLKKDPDFERESFVDSPGAKTHMEKKVV